MRYAKPQLFVKYWQFSRDDNGKDIVELMTAEGKILKLQDYYVDIWKLIDGDRTVDDIVSVFISSYSENTGEEVQEAVLSCLIDLNNAELIVLNWNPFE